MPNRTETYACHHCGTDVTRKVARGQRPKWCDGCRRLRLMVCQGCHEVKRFSGGNKCCPDCVERKRVPHEWACTNCGTRLDSNRKYCNPECWPNQSDMRSPLRRAIESCDWPAAVDALRADCLVVDGCWEWQRQLSKDGYPLVRVGSKNRIGAHRLMLSVANGGVDVGVHSTHHECANPRCINPDHLVPATHAANVAEMKARQSYVRRIAELEAALLAIDPTNRVLQVLPFI